MRKGTPLHPRQLRHRSGKGAGGALWGPTSWSYQKQMGDGGLARLRRACPPSLPCFLPSSHSGPGILSHASETQGLCTCCSSAWNPP